MRLGSRHRPQAAASAVPPATTGGRTARGASRHVREHQAAPSQAAHGRTGQRVPRSPTIAAHTRESTVVIAALSTHMPHH